MFSNLLVVGEAFPPDPICGIKLLKGVGVGFFFTLWCCVPIIIIGTQHQRVWFLTPSSQKLGTDFDHLGLKVGNVMYLK